MFDFRVIIFLVVVSFVVLFLKLVYLFRSNWDWIKIDLLNTLCVRSVIFCIILMIVMKWFVVEK